MIECAFCKKLWKRDVGIYHHEKSDGCPLSETWLFLPGPIKAINEAIEKSKDSERIEIARYMESLTNIIKACGFPIDSDDFAIAKKAMDDANLFVGKDKYPISELIKKRIDVLTENSFHIVHESDGTVYFYRGDPKTSDPVYVGKTFKGEKS